MPLARPAHLHPLVPVPLRAPASLPAPSARSEPADLQVSDEEAVANKTTAPAAADGGAGAVAYVNPPKFGAHTLSNAPLKNAAAPGAPGLTRPHLRRD